MRKISYSDDYEQHNDHVYLLVHTLRMYHDLVVLTFIVMYLYEECN